jgi:hypothetical protein
MLLSDLAQHRADIPGYDHSRPLGVCGGLAIASTEAHGLRESLFKYLDLRPSALGSTLVIHRFGFVQFFA